MRATRRRRSPRRRGSRAQGRSSAAEPVEQQQPVRVPEEGGAAEDPLERHRRHERHHGERCDRTREPPSRGAAREPDGERDEQERLGVDGIALLDPDRLPRGGRRSERDEPDDAGRRDGEVGRQGPSRLRARTSIPRCREQQRERERGRDTRGEHQRAGVRGRETEDVAGVVCRRGVALVDAERRHQRATARNPQPQPETREHGETAERGQPRADASPLGEREGHDRGREDRQQEQSLEAREGGEHDRADRERLGASASAIRAPVRSRARRARRAAARPSRASASRSAPASAAAA